VAVSARRATASAPAAAAAIAASAPGATTVAAAATVPSSDRKDVRAAGLAVSLAGDESAPPLVLLHGLAERRQVFDRLVPLLAPHVRVAAIDLPGFGGSPPLSDGGFDLGVVCERVEAAIAELGLERPAMLGHSLGGGVAVRYAAERPGALRALTLIAPAGLIATGAVRPSWRHPRLHALRRTVLRAATPVIAASRGLRERAFARVVGDPRALDAALARELLMGAAQGRSTPAAGIEIVYAGLRDRLDELTLPALVIWGGRDRVVSPRYAELLRDALADGRLLLLPGAGHVPMCEEPAEVADAVLQLLTRRARC
jgi:pimeloyl-ACP methyl ester carboxylesterase